MIKGAEFVRYCYDISQIKCDCESCRTSTDQDKRSLIMLQFAVLRKGLSEGYLEQIASRGFKPGVFWALLGGLCYDLITVAGVEILVECCDIVEVEKAADEIILRLSRMANRISSVLEESRNDEDSKLSHKGDIN